MDRGEILMFSGWLDIPGYTFYQVNLEQCSMRLKSGFTSVLESIETREYDGKLYYGLIKGFEREIIKRWYSIESIKRMLIEIKKARPSSCYYALKIEYSIFIQTEKVSISFSTKTRCHWLSPISSLLTITPLEVFAFLSLS